MSSVVRTRTPEEVALAVVAATKAHEPEAMVALGHPDYVDDFVPIGEKRGREAIRAFFAEISPRFRTSSSRPSASSPTIATPYCSGRQAAPSRAAASRASSRPGAESSTAAWT
jgi:hypothetical protein